MAVIDYFLLVITGACLYITLGMLFAHIFLFRWDTKARNEEAFIAVLLAWPIAIVVIPIVFIFSAIIAALKKHEWDFDFALAKLFKRRVHQDEYGILYRMPSPWGEVRAVKVKDSTGTYWIPVPRDMRRAKQAVAWTYSMHEDEFHPVRA